MFWKLFALVVVLVGVPQGFIITQVIPIKSDIAVLKNTVAAISKSTKDHIDSNRDRLDGLEERERNERLFHYRHDFPKTSTTLTKGE